MPPSDPPALPASNAGHAHPPDLAPRYTLPQLNRPDGRPWLALLADDNPVNREVGAGLLQALGLAVHTAEDGQEVLHKAQMLRYDLVLMDLQMPRLDGLSATRGLRAMVHGSQVPVIAVSADIDTHSRQACLAAGMNDFVAKPIDIRLLADALMRWLPRA